MKGSITIRIYLKDYNRVRKIFKAQRGESAASYFERLSKWLEAQMGEDILIGQRGDIKYFTKK